MIVLLAGIGLATEASLERSLSRILINNLEAVISAERHSLQLWIEAQRAETQSWAQTAGLSEAASKLLQAQSATEGARPPALEREIGNVREALEGIEHNRAHLQYLILDRGGKILAAPSDEVVGRRIAVDVAPHLTSIFAQKIYNSRPVLLDAIVLDGALEEPRPMLVTGAIIRPFESEGEVETALMILLDPQVDFSRILSVARLGSSGKTFAFDRDGVLLSNTHYDEVLRQLGVLPPGSFGSMLTMKAVDPGGDLTKGYKPTKGVMELPLTRSVAQAIQSRNGGYELKTYRDFRGVEVLGAWEWLPEFDIGLATELDLAEVRAAIFPLKLAFGFLYSLVVLAAGFILYRNYSTRLMKARFEQVRQLDKYELIEKVGEGGMGSIFRARHELLTRPTAIKLLNEREASADDVARFEREVQMTARLTHPNTIEIYDYGQTEEGVFYYVMEYLNGISLAKLIEVEGHLPPARVVHLLKQVLGSLREAHAQGFIHRDIKPQNLFICQRGGIYDFVKVLDFGLVKDLFAGNEHFETANDILAGTPLYIAPERLRNPQYLDPRSDLYSLGIVAFNLLTGDDPYRAETHYDLTNKILTEPVARPSERVKQPVPPGLDQLVLDLLAKDPEQRPASAAEVLKRLDAIEMEERWGDEEARAWAEAHAEWFAYPAPDDPAESHRTIEHVVQRRRIPPKRGGPPLPGDGNRG